MICRFFWPTADIQEHASSGGDSTDESFAENFGFGSGVVLNLSEAVPVGRLVGTVGGCFPLRGPEGFEATVAAETFAGEGIGRKLDFVGEFEVLGGIFPTVTEGLNSESEGGVLADSTIFG